MNNSLLEEIVQSIKQVDGYGSVEIFIQDHVITQITTRKITKTNSGAKKHSHKTNDSIDKAMSMN